MRNGRRSDEFQTIEWLIHIHATPTQYYQWRCTQGIKHTMSHINLTISALVM